VGPSFNPWHFRLLPPQRRLPERTGRTGFLVWHPERVSDSIHNRVNIGNPHELTVHEIAKLIMKLTGSNSSIEYRPLPADDSRVRRPDIRRAKALLDWEPKVELEDGLRKTIEYFRQLL